MSDQRNSVEIWGYVFGDPPLLQVDDPDTPLRVDRFGFDYHRALQEVRDLKSSAC